MQNEMMHRPTVDTRVLKYLREEQDLGLSEEVYQIQAKSRANDVPIIPNETVAFFRFLFSQIKPKKILEVGTAYGFSAAAFVDLLQKDVQVTTIDRFETMIENAKMNFEAANVTNNITLLEGQASEILPTLPAEEYDMIFLDSAKSKYVEFLPQCLQLVKTGGIIVIDDVFQGGTVFDPDDTIRRGARKIHKRLKQLLAVANETEGLTSVLLPLGDGLLLMTKEIANVKINYVLD